jgi:Lrp/AsnC family leucine-responsive transcriptional regulator
MSKSVFKGEFDNLDRMILEALQADGRMSVADLGRKIHLSPPAIYQRIKRLERAGMIKGYAALVDREKAGYDVLCFIRLCLQPATLEQLTRFQESVSALPEVVECYHTAGSHQLLLKVLVRDHRALDQLIKERLMTVPGVERIETSVVLSEIKATTTIALE